MSSFPPRCKGLRKPHPSHLRSQALVITLALVVLATILVAAFFSMVSLDRTATASYNQSLKSEQLGIGGLQMVIGQLQQEMSKDAPPDTGAGLYPNSPIYTNVTSANILPQGVGTNSAMPVLLKTSSTTPFFDGTNAGVTKLGISSAGISSTAPSLNGRSVTLSRWNQAYMGTFPNNSSAPNWILMTRGGPTNAAGISFGATTANTLNNPVYGNTNYAIGRVAYAIYDEGSLLDITVAGYPSSLASYPTELSQLKGSLAGVSLTNALNIGSTISDTIINWRNAKSSAGSNPVTYVSYARTNGFQTIYPGDTTFLSRQDLIQAAQDPATTGINPTMLPNLATFTREVNAPSWGPTTPSGSTINYAGIGNTASSTNRFLPLVRSTTAGTVTDYLDDGTTTTYSINAGDPVAQRRFSLARLKWLGPAGINTSAFNSSLSAAQQQAAVQACFGLVWQASADSALVGGSSGNATAPSVWVYVGSSSPGSTTEASSIETPSQIAAETTARAPNFFELLQAGILSGSVGLSASSGTGIPAGHEAGQGGAMLQILRIGASMINQYGSYSSAGTFYPAVIEFKEPATGDYWRACGVENLPGVASMTTVVGDNWAAAGTSDEPTTHTTSGSTAFITANMPTSVTGLVYLMFGLWNPNQVSSDSTNASETPPSVRLHVKGYYGISCYYGASSLPTTSVGATTYPGYDFPSQIDTTIPLQATAGTQNGVYGFANSGVLTLNDAPSTSYTSPASTQSYPNVSWQKTYPMGVKGDSLLGLRLPDFPFSTWTASKTDAAQHGLVFLYGNSTVPFNAYMEFKDPSGAWIPYQFLTGINDPVSWLAGVTSSKGQIVGATQTNYNPPSGPHTGPYFMNYLCPLNMSSFSPTARNGWSSQNGDSLSDATVGTGGLDVWGALDYPQIFLSGDPRSVRFNTWVMDLSAQQASGYFNNPTDSVVYTCEHSDLWVPAVDCVTAPYAGASATAGAVGGGSLASGYGGGVQGVSGGRVVLNPPALFPSVYYPAQLARNNNANASAYVAGNNTASGSTPNSSYTDKDGIMRIGDSGYFTDTTGTVGNPTYNNNAAKLLSPLSASTYAARIADQPILLRRPFNSVAEMGYAFRDDPWRSLDFFSGKSADAGLLDLFCLYAVPNGVAHGRIDLNTHNSTLIQSLLTGTVDDVMKTNIISSSAASSVAAAYTTLTTATPLVNKANLTTSFIGTTAFPSTGFSTDEQMVKPQREATARALADVGETRTWNLMIDLVAQVGKYPPTSTTMDQFVVEGERHYWLHVAIDRFTGKVVDQQLEVVTQ
jgi:hypothetical protein